MIRPYEEKHCGVCNKSFMVGGQGEYKRRKRFCSHACANIGMAIPVKDRLLAKTVVRDDGCWIYTGGRRGYGAGADAYGRITIRHIGYAAHRVSYELFVGPITDGLMVLHKCDVKGCINPDHLFLGDHYDNAEDMFNKGRANRKPVKMHPPRPPVKQGVCGERHPLAKLTVQDVRDIREAHAKGVRRSVLAAKYQMHPTHLGKIICRALWNHVA